MITQTSTIKELTSLALTPALRQVAALFASDPDFRANLQENAVETLKKIQLEITPEELAVIDLYVATVPLIHVGGFKVLQDSCWQTNR